MAVCVIVKFYPPDPSQLTEDITRYRSCSPPLAALKGCRCRLMASLLVSAGICCASSWGRTSPRAGCPAPSSPHALLGSYTRAGGARGPTTPRSIVWTTSQTSSFAPNQTKELEEKVVELHKSHRSDNSRIYSITEVIWRGVTGIEHSLMCWFKFKRFGFSVNKCERCVIKVEILHCFCRPAVCIQWIMHRVFAYDLLVWIMIGFTLWYCNVLKMVYTMHIVICFIRE